MDHCGIMNMRGRLSICLWLVAAFGFGLPDGASAQNSSADEALESLMQDYWEAQIQAFPLAASAFGEHRYRDRIDDLGPEALEANKARLDATIKLLAEIALEALNKRSRENYDAFHWMLTHERRNLDFKTGYFTFNTLGGWHTAFPRVVLITPYSTEKDYRDLLKRLQAFATYAQQNMDLMRLGIETGYTQPCELLKDYENTITGYIAGTPEESVFIRPFDAMPDTIPPAKRQHLRSEAWRLVQEVIHPAYEAFARFFIDTYRPACREAVALSSLPGGREAYDHALRYYTSLDTDAQRVHSLGLSEVTRIRGEMQRVIEEAEFDGGIADFLAYLRSEQKSYASDEESYLHRVAWIAKSIESRLPSFFAKLPSNPFGISVVPQQIAPITTTAYYQPGAGDGTRAGQFFVNTYDLPSRPLYELPALAWHESVPGHHTQISFQSENTSLPDWRRVYYFHAFGEGWGLYAEYLGEEMGMYTTPYERFGRLIYEMWRAARLVVDTGLHAKGWTRAQAIDYMLVNTGLTRTNVIAEVDRYISYPGQATAYKHGELKILELRKRSEMALGKDFDLRDFHVQVLAGGSLPLGVLDTRIQRWIDNQLATATRSDQTPLLELRDPTGTP